jgi:hypothetical protein
VYLIRDFESFGTRSHTPKISRFTLVTEISLNFLVEAKRCNTETAESRAQAPPIASEAYLSLASAGAIPLVYDIGNQQVRASPEDNASDVSL